MVNRFTVAFNLLLIAINRANSVDHYVENVADNGTVSYFSYDPESPNSPDRWETFAPNCGGLSQSPIIIPYYDLCVFCFRSFLLTKFLEKPESMKIRNDGHTVLFYFTYKDKGRPTMMYNDTVYEFVHISFHFGLNDNDGTEHRIDEKALTMEGQLLYYNTMYGTYENALNYYNGLAIISQMFRRDSYSIHEMYEVLVNYDFLQYVRNPNDEHILNATNDLYSLFDIIGPLRGHYNTYHGSLTTPGCNEVVRWFIGRYIMYISTDNIAQFRKLRGWNGLMAPNIRPIQPLNNRTISARYYTQTYMLT